jgi:hypothetical protein
MRNNPDLRLRVVGSSAWPGPKGKFTAAQIEQTALDRAQAIVDVLVANGIGAERLIAEASLPPLEHRESLDSKVHAKDRYVQVSPMTGPQ